jgi:hypothetical protein
MGQILIQNVSSSVCNFYFYSSTNRFILRPSGQEKDLVNIVMDVPNVDYDKISTSREELIKSFYSITKRTDIVFGDLVWISKYRLEQVFLLKNKLN